MPDVGQRNATTFRQLVCQNTPPLSVGRLMTDRLVRMISSRASASCEHRSRSETENGRSSTRVSPVFRSITVSCETTDAVSEKLAPSLRVLKSFFLDHKTRNGDGSPKTSGITAAVDLRDHSSLPVGASTANKVPKSTRSSPTADEFDNPYRIGAFVLTIT